MKGAALIREIVASISEAVWLAAPGTGFTDCPAFIPTGRIDSAQVIQLLRHVDGLVVPSRYEGLPLVVLEALGQGTKVVAFEVGGLSSLPADLAGYFPVAPRNIDAFSLALRVALKEPTAGREERCSINRERLWTWHSVAEVLKKTVEQSLRRSS
jgi:glycosyltransferase involved in cell wall biosynthesis